ncbi:hypothetical protein M8818_005921 [Zalaria obscura]|uniref:Uncharacterized protein n=1 Tax=Zalaria obscura TaxID=2024903 RepID=A0ACC3SAS8_9PEZI
MEAGSAVVPLAPRQPCSRSMPIGLPIVQLQLFIVQLVSEAGMKRLDPWKTPYHASEAVLTMPSCVSSSLVSSRKLSRYRFNGQDQDSKLPPYPGTLPKAVRASSQAGRMVGIPNFFFHRVYKDRSLRAWRLSQWI